MGIFNKIKTKLKLAKSKMKGRKYTSLQMPVRDMSFEEVCKEFYKKEKVIFSLEDNFEGRNFDLLKKFLLDNPKENFKIDYLVKVLNDDNISKGVKVNFVEIFINFYEKEDLLKLFDKNDNEVNESVKRTISRVCVEKLPEELLIQYYDYTNIEKGYLRRLLKCVSIEGKVNILNKLNNKELKESLLLEQTNKMDFDEAKELYEKVILYDYEQIENFYIDRIKSSDSETVLDIVNKIDYISPNVAKELDKLIEHKSVSEVIDYINNNDVKKGGVIYLNRMFNFEDKKQVFYGLDKEEDRKNALVIFTEDVGKNELVQMLKDEKNDNIRMEILHNIPMLLNEKERFFSEVEIGELL